MKKVLAILLLATLTISARATGYYASSASGADGGAGTFASPYQTLAKLNSLVLSNIQDTIYLKAGESFPGSLIIKYSNVYVTSYGSGARPIITGWLTLSGWASLGNGQYGATCAGCKIYQNIVTMNGVQQHIARTPNSGWRTYSSGTSTTLTDTSLASVVGSYIGGDVVIRFNQSQLSTNPITGQTTSLLTFTNLAGATPTNGWGYYFQNDSLALDTLGEWIYSPGTGTIKMYFGANTPSNYTIQAPVVDTLIKIYPGKKNVTIDGINLQGAQLFGIYSDVHDTNVIVKNTTINFSGAAGIWDSACVNCSWINNYINHSNDNGIVHRDSSHNAYTAYDTIFNSGMMLGQGRYYPTHNYSGINSHSSKGIIEYNWIDSSGYDGIQTFQDSSINHNYVDYYCWLMDDGGGIYHLGYVWPAKQQLIYGNVVTNGIGAPQGAPAGKTYANGIYLDANNHNVRVYNNSVSGNSNFGIFLHNSLGITVTDNSLYNNLGNIAIQSDNISQPVNTLYITRNISSLASNNQLHNNFYYYNNARFFSSIGFIDSNYYVAPSSITQPFSAAGIRTYTSWKDSLPTDQHSALTNNSALYQYNPTQNAKTVSLPGTYTDVKSNAYVNSAGLLSLSSLVLLPSSSGTGTPSETHDMIVFDDSIPVRNASNNGQGTGGYRWLIRVWMDRTYLADVAADPSKARPVLISTGGKGEVRTGVYGKQVDGNGNVTYAGDSAMLHLYGWEYDRQNRGFTGKLSLGNGDHYPIYITAVQPVVNLRPWYITAFIQDVIAKYKARGGYVHTAGLSEGAYYWTCQIPYSNNTVNNPLAMSQIKSIVDLEGVGPETFQSFDYALPGAFGTWASNYGGRVFGLEGTNDGVGANIYPQIVQPMNNVVPNSGYHAFENFGNGTHCCWTSMYDYTQTNWTCTPSGLLGNSGITYSSTNVMGSYKYDATHGANIYQWMIRQGDTTLVSSGTPIVSPGSNQVFYSPQTSTTTTAAVTYQNGNVANTLTWSQLSGPNTANIANGNTLTPTFGSLIVGTYVFTLAAVDNTGAIGPGNLQVQVLAAVAPTMTAGGPYNIVSPTTSVILTGTATAGSATLSGTNWSQTSGPNSASIVSPGSLTTTVMGLVPGIYTFQITGTDVNGLTGIANATVSVTTSAIIAPSVMVATGEYQTFILSLDSLVYGISTVSNNIGIGGAQALGYPQRLITSPANLKFIGVYPSLHMGAAIDVNTFVWTWGDNDVGENGIGTVSATPTATPVKITVDSLGNPFNNVKKLVAGYMMNAWSNWYALKNDGTLWAWGGLYSGARGDGTYGGVSSRPVQIPIPGGKTVKDVLAGSYLLVLCTDGTVYSCGGGGGQSAGSANAADLGNLNTGTGWLTLTQLPNLSNVIGIAGGIKWSWAWTTTKLYSWGGWGTYQGKNGTGGGNQVTQPTEATEVEAIIPATNIREIVTNSETTHFLTKDGKLYGCGDNAQGGVGNGVQLNWITYTYPWAYDLGTPGGLLQILPVQLAVGKSNFAHIFGGSTFVYDTWVTDSNNRFFSFGRNKVSILGNGIRDPSGGAISSNYPDTWNVSEITEVFPFSLTGTFITTCEGCITGFLSTTTGTPCASYNIPVNIAPKAVLVASVLNGNQIVLDASGSSDNVHISYYKHTQTAGTALQMALATGVKDTISNVGPGTYQFKLVVTDNGWYRDSTTTSITLGTTGNIPPTVSASTPSASINLSDQKAVLNGVATANSGSSISNVSWSQVSGPTTVTFDNPNVLSCQALNMTSVGTYIFKFTATDTNGLQSSTTVTVQVNFNYFLKFSKLTKFS